MFYMVSAILICAITLFLLFEMLDEIIENKVIKGHVKLYILLILFTLLVAFIQ